MRPTSIKLKTVFALFAFLMINISITSAAEYTVKFVRFLVSQQGEQVYLKWSTDSEINSNYFKVQRSYDGGSSWDDIGLVESSGNTPGSGTYYYQDANPAPGSVYYRIKASDFNGGVLYSPIREIHITPFTEDEAEIEVQVYPNPSTSFVIIDGEEDLDDLTVQLMDISGKVLPIQQELNGPQIRLEPVHKLSGMFFLILHRGDQQLIRKLEFK